MCNEVRAYLDGWSDAERTFLDSMSYAPDEAVVHVVRQRIRELGIPDRRPEKQR